MLVVEGLGVALGGRNLFQGLTFSISPGQSLAVIGPSGAGKSTLLAIIAGFQSPSAGKVELNLDPKRGIEWLVQSSPMLARRSALDNALLAARIKSGDSRGVVQEAVAVLTSLGIGSLVQQSAHKLSGGERQRVAVARAILARPGLLLADEPTASLDPVSRQAVLDGLATLARSGTAIIVATHDPVVGDACTSALYLDQYLHAG